MLSNIPQSEEISLAPGEGKQPTSILTDEYCEELSHPHLFPTGKFGYKVERNVKLSPVRYFNQRLLYYTQKFASDADYIFCSFCYAAKGTPAYWKRFLFEVLAMVKQLGLPTFFMTLSCADLHWNELVLIISKLNGDNFCEE